MQNGVQWSLKELFHRTQNEWMNNAVWHSGFAFCWEVVNYKHNVGNTINWTDLQVLIWIYKQMYLSHCANHYCYMGVVARLLYDFNESTTQTLLAFYYYFTELCFSVSDFWWAVEDVERKKNEYCQKLGEVANLIWRRRLSEAKFRLCWCKCALAHRFSYRSGRSR